MLARGGFLHCHFPLQLLQLLLLLGLSRPGSLGRSVLGHTGQGWIGLGLCVSLSTSRLGLGLGWACCGHRGRLQQLVVQLL